MPPHNTAAAMKPNAKLRTGCMPMAADTSKAMMHTAHQGKNWWAPHEKSNTTVKKTTLFIVLVFA